MTPRSRTVALAAVLAVVLAAGVVRIAGHDEVGGGGLGLVRLPAGSDTRAESPLGGEYPYSLVEYRVEGRLGELAGTAPAYRLGGVGQAGVARLARALGLKGPVEDHDGSWSVRHDGRELVVERSWPMAWYLGPACPDSPAMPERSDGGDRVVCALGGGVAGGGSIVGPGGAGHELPATTPECEDTGACAETSPAEPCGPGGTCVEPEEPQPPVVPVEPVDLPTREEAEALSRETFAALGVDLEHFSLTEGWGAWEARVVARVGGLRVHGLATALSVGSGGEIVRASGFAGRPERLGEYPLVGLEKGLARLSGDGPGGVAPRPFPGGSAPRPGGDDDMCAEPEALCDPPAGDEPGPGTEPDPGALPEPEPIPEPTPVPTPVPEPAPEHVPLPAVVRTVSGVHLGLMAVGEVLVPVYVFELDGGEEVPVPAVADEWLEAEPVPDRLVPRRPPVGPITPGMPRPVPLPEPSTVPSTEPTPGP